LKRFRTEELPELRRKGLSPGDAWEQFRKTEAFYRDLVRELARSQHGLCVYCERRVTDKQGKPIKGSCSIEHIVPKSFGLGPTFDWTNLALACHKAGRKKSDGSCGQTKANSNLPRHCDPHGFAVSPKMVCIGEDGRIMPDTEGCAHAGIDVASLEDAMNRILNLNSEPLRQARESVLGLAQQEIDALLAEFSGEGVSSDEQCEPYFELMEGYLGPDASGHLREFWTTLRCVFGSPAEQWIANNRKVLA